MDDWREINRNRWDEEVSGHLASGVYDIAGFRAGRPQLLPFEAEEIGPLDGARLVHLQCHVGLDTLDLARLHPTSSVVGLDFSRAAIDTARTLAGSSRLGDRARFEVADVFDAVNLIGAGGADVVYTGKGALRWLPDVARWAGVVHELLKPGGFLYLCEFHPVASVLGDEAPKPVTDYFRTDPLVVEGEGQEPAADPDSGTVPRTPPTWVQWQHPLDRVIGSLLQCGLRLQLFHEWSVTSSHQSPWLVPHPEDARLWTWPGPGSLPLMYSVKAFKPPA